MNSCYATSVLVGIRLTNTERTTQLRFLGAFLRGAQRLAFIAVVLAGGGSSFGSLDLDELSSPDFGIEQSALPAAVEKHVLIQKKALVPWRNESRVVSRNSLTTMRGLPESLQNFYCWYKHIPERGPPLLL